MPFHGGPDEHVRLNSILQRNIENRNDLSMGLIFGKSLGRMVMSCYRPFISLMVGLDATGKTTILYKMKLGEVVTTIPTTCMSVHSMFSHNIDCETVSNSNFSFLT